jgi:hypothetical protein
MKKTKPLFLALGTLTVMGLLAARPGDILTDLGLTREQLQEQVLESVKQQSVSLYAPSETRDLARRMPESARAMAVQALGKLVRTYTESPTFKETYLKDLKAELAEQMPVEEQKEQAPDVALKGDNGMAVIQELYGDMPVSLLVLTAKEQIKEATASPNGRTKATTSTKALEGKELRRLVALHDKSPEEFKKQYLTYLGANVDPSVYLIKSSKRRHVDQQQLDEMKKELNEDYKARSDVNAVIRQQLTDFIGLVNSVDFNAKLVKQGQKMVFANPDYESQSSDWKVLFRMGREPVMAARAFAQQWQADLAKKQK